LKFCGAYLKCDGEGVFLNQNISLAIRWGVYGTNVNKS
jgi:hypothetical protein